MGIIICGLNGCGKSTIGRVLDGGHPPDMNHRNPH